jgi:hypothetical protein
MLYINKYFVGLDVSEVLTEWKPSWKILNFKQVIKLMKQELYRIPRQIDISVYSRHAELISQLHHSSMVKV